MVVLVRLGLRQTRGQRDARACVNSAAAAPCGLANAVVSVDRGVDTLATVSFSRPVPVSIATGSPAAVRRRRRAGHRDARRARDRRQRIVVVLHGELTTETVAVPGSCRRRSSASVRPTLPSAATSIHSSRSPKRQPSGSCSSSPSAADRGDRRDLLVEPLSMLSLLLTTIADARNADVGRVDGRRGRAVVVRLVEPSS